MIGSIAVTFAAGLLALGAAVCVAFNEGLSAPDRPNYPNASALERAAMFIWLLFLSYRGVEILTQMFAPSPVYVTNGTLWAAMACFFVEAVRLEHQARRWLPARLQARVRRLWEIASCRQKPAMQAERVRNNAAVRPGAQRFEASADVVGPALGALALEGVRAIGPGEGAEVIGSLPPVGHPTPRESLGLPPLSRQEVRH